MRSISLFLILVAFGCTPGSPESRLRARVDELTSDGVLPRLDPDAVATAESLEFRARLREIHHALEEIAPYDADDPLRFRHRDEPERLAAGLAGLDGFFDAVAALLAEPFVQAALAEGRPFGFHLSEPQAKKDPLAGERWNRPELGLHGHWTTLMCLKAIQLARTPGGSQAAADLLACGFDLALLIEDHSLYGYETRSSSEWQLVDAVQVVGTETDADPAIVRAALDARLERAMELEHALEAVTMETAHWTDSALGELAGSEGYGVLEGHPQEAELRVQLIEGTDSALDDFLQILNADEPCRDYSPLDLDRPHNVSSLTAMRTWYSLRLKLLVARVGLAVSEHVHATGEWPENVPVLAERFEDGLPANPCSHRVIRLNRTREELELRLSGPPCPVEDVWRWSRVEAETDLDQ